MTEVQEQSADQVSLSELAETCTDRACTYAFLSQLFKIEVPADLLEQLSAVRFPINTGNDNLDEGYKLFASYLSAPSDNALTELAVDYVHVFLGHGVDSYSAAYPYESVYTSEKRLLMQAARDEVLAIYRSQHLDKTPVWKESEDHIAAELEFMQIMAERTADTLLKNDVNAAYALLKVQRNFLGDQ